MPIKQLNAALSAVSIAAAATGRKNMGSRAPSRGAFVGRTAVITGAASGIGLALAGQMAAQGAHVVLADIDADTARARAAALSDQGMKATAVALDVTDRSAVEDLLKQVAAENDALDFVFNNAGIGGTLPFHEATPQHWDRILSLNLRSVIDGTDLAYRVMREQGHGHIINTASISGLVPVPLQTLYNTTKFAVVGLSTTLRPEAAAHGVQVSVVCPGQVATAIWGTPILGAKDPAAVAPAQAVSADRAARTILHGVQRNRPLITFPATARALALGYRHLPALSDRWLHAEYKRRTGSI